MWCQDSDSPLQLVVLARQQRGVMLVPNSRGLRRSTLHPPMLHKNLIPRATATFTALFCLSLTMVCAPCAVRRTAQCAQCSAHGSERRTSMSMSESEGPAHHDGIHKLICHSESRKHQSNHDRPCSKMTVSFYNHILPALGATSARIRN